MYFDPSKGINGYTKEEYIKLLSIYTNDHIKSVTNGQDYFILSQRAIVCSQRYNNIEFTDNAYPIISHPLNEFKHYIPNWNYTPEELQVFYKHYNNTKLDIVHMQFERSYPLDPSFVKLVKWLKTEAPDSVINHLCLIFNETDREMLFANRYKCNCSDIESDVNIELLQSSPELFLSQNAKISDIKPKPKVDIEPLPPRPKKKGDDSIIRINKNKKVEVLEDIEEDDYENRFKLGRFIDHPIIKEYVKELENTEVSDDNNLITRIIKNTAPKSNQRYELLSVIPLSKLQTYASRHNISILDPVNEIDRRHNVITALMLIKSDLHLTGAEPFVPIDYGRLDVYSLEELKPLADMYGIEISKLSRMDILNNIYLLQFIPSFYVPTNYDCRDSSNDVTYLYGLRYKNYTVCISRNELIQSFSQNKDFIHEGIVFNYHAVNKLYYLATFDKSNESDKLKNVITQLFESNLDTYENDISFLKSIPDEQIIIGDEETTTYKQLVYDVFTYLRYLSELINTKPNSIDESLNRFMDMIEQIPSIVTDVIVRLPCQGSKLTIGELYNKLMSKKSLKGVDKILLDTANKYLEML